MRSLVIFFLICFCLFFGFVHVFKTGKLQRYLDKHPNPSWGVRTQYYISKYFAMRGEYQKAIESADRVLKVYPKSSFAEFALYIKANSLNAQGMRKEASKAYELFLKTYPNSIKARTAKKKYQFLSS